MSSDKKVIVVKKNDRILYRQKIIQPDGEYGEAVLGGNSNFITDYSKSITRVMAKFTLDRPSESGRVNIVSPFIYATVTLPDTISFGAMAYTTNSIWDSSIRYYHKSNSTSFNIKGFNFGEDIVEIRSSTSTITISINGISKSIYYLPEQDMWNTSGITNIKRQIQIGSENYIGNIYYVNCYFLSDEVAKFTPMKKDGITGLYDSIEDVFTPFTGNTVNVK